MRRSLLLVGSLLFACGGAPGAADAGADGALDAATLDAATRDASAADAETDAGADAASMDAGPVSCDGTARRDLGTAVQLARGFVIARDGTMYFSQIGGLGRVLPDGTIEASWATIAGAPTITGLALDAANERLFVGVVRESGSADPSVYRVEIATAAATPIVNGGFPFGLTIGPDGSLYYGDVLTEHVLRVSPDGGAPAQVTTSTVPSVGCLAFEASGTLLVTGRSPGQIFRLTLGASGAETARAMVGSPLPTPTGIALDATGRIYVTSEFGGVLVRMNADGSDAMTVRSALSAPSSLDFGHGALCRSDLYLVATGQIVRVENDTPGASVSWH
jgi:sugar lactone lactonase YvrE